MHIGRRDMEPESVENPLRDPNAHAAPAVAPFEASDGVRRRKPERWVFCAKVPIAGREPTAATSPTATQPLASSARRRQAARKHVEDVSRWKLSRWDHR